jgi:adenylate kinase family enzyme
MRRLERVFVIGTSGSGKTRLAKRLAEAVGADHVELDDLYWGPDWSEPEPEVFRADVARRVSEPRWVMDGNYAASRDVAWSRATHLVWLNYGFPTIFSRMLRRTLRRVLTGQELWSGNRETWRSLVSRDSMLLWVIRTFPQRRREYRELLGRSEISHLEVLELTAPHDAESWLQDVEHARSASPISTV